MSPQGRSSFLTVGRKIYQEARSLTADRTPHPAYSSITAPALLMTAEHSPLAARRVAEILSEQLPDARLLHIEEAGHMAPLTHGHQVNSAILEHLREVEAGSLSSS